MKIYVPRVHSPFSDKVLSDKICCLGRYNGSIVESLLRRLHMTVLLPVQDVHATIWNI